MSHSTKDIINLTRLGTNDGGSQTACSFLQELAVQGNLRDYCVVAFEGTNTGELTKKLGFESVLVNRNLRTRLHWDFFCRKHFEKDQLCFTFHGVPWFRSKGYLVNLCGAADSNLYYPEIPFWKHHSISRRLMKYVKDRGRMYGYSRADFWIFETQKLAERANALAGYPVNRVAVVKMSASTFVTPAKVEANRRDDFKSRIGKGFALLFMAGANPNKRIDRVGRAIVEIQAKKLTDLPIRIVTTLDTKSIYYNTLRLEFERLGVSDSWVNLGSVDIAHVPSLIDACNVVCLFSMLESFSSNFTEAWAMRKPLLVTDADWARASCGNAAVYVNPEDCSALAVAIAQLTKPDKQKELLANYEKHFDSYPSAQERCRQYLECMEQARSLGRIASLESRAVRKFTSKKG